MAAWLFGRRISVPTCLEQRVTADQIPYIGCVQWTRLLDIEVAGRNDTTGAEYGTTNAVNFCENRHSGLPYAANAYNRSSEQDSWKDVCSITSILASWLDASIKRYVFCSLSR